MKTSLPTNSKFKFIYLVIILLFLLLAIGVWMYYKLKLKEIEKNYRDQPVAKEFLKNQQAIQSSIVKWYLPITSY